MFNPALSKTLYKYLLREFLDIFFPRLSKQEKCFVELCFNHKFKMNLSELMSKRTLYPLLIRV